MMSGHVHEMAAVASTLPNVVATIAKPFRSDALIALVQQTLKEGPLEERPTFPSEKEIARAKAADFTISKTPILPQPEQEPASPPPTSAHPRQWRAELSRRRSRNSSPKTRPEEPRAGSQELAPPQPPGIPSRVTKKTAPLQKSDGILTRLAPNEVMLDLPPRCRRDAGQLCVSDRSQIRARPASSTVAIEVPANGKAALPLKTGFQLGPIDLDATGNISIVRLIPTSRPFRAAEMRSAFEIDGVTVVPANERERLQLMSTAASMTMQLFAPPRAHLGRAWSKPVKSRSWSSVAVPKPSASR